MPLISTDIAHATLATQVGGPPYRAWRIGPYGLWGVQGAGGINVLQMPGGAVLTTSRELAEAAITRAGFVPGPPNA